MRSTPGYIENLRKRLVSYIGSSEPFCIIKKNEEVIVTFIRGFADPDRNIILISEKSDSLGMNFIEIKNIEEIQPWMKSAA